jgi:hypothetical protein
LPGLGRHANLTSGFNPRRVHGKLLYAYDSAKGNEIRPSEEYFLDAIATVRDNQRTYLRHRKSGLAESRFGFLADC